MRKAGLPHRKTPSFRLGPQFLLVVLVVWVNEFCEFLQELDDVRSFPSVESLGVIVGPVPGRVVNLQEEGVRDVRCFVHAPILPRATPT